MPIHYNKIAQHSTCKYITAIGGGEDGGERRRGERGGGGCCSLGGVEAGAAGQQPQKGLQVMMEAVPRYLPRKLTGLKSVQGLWGLAPLWQRPQQGQLRQSAGQE